MMSSNRTKNELNRITYKINMLKGVAPFNDEFHYLNNQFRDKRQPLQHASRNRKQQVRNMDSQNQWQRQFRVFRTEIHHFITQKLNMIGKDEDIKQLDSRCQKIQEQLSNFLTIQLQRHQSQSQYKKQICDKFDRLQQTIQQKLSVKQKSNKGQLINESKWNEKIQSLEHKLLSSNMQTQLSQIKKNINDMNNKTMMLTNNISNMQSYLQNNQKHLQTIQELVNKERDGMLKTVCYDEHMEGIQDDIKNLSKKLICYEQDIQGFKKWQRLGEIKQKQMISGIEQKINIVKHELHQQITHIFDNKVSNDIHRLLSLANTQNVSQKNKQTSNNEEDNEGILLKIDQKLQQFQTDVNNALKLLYDDVQTKMNEAISSSGILQIHSQIKGFKDGIIDGVNVRELENGIYRKVGEQIDRIGGILESTVQKIDQKTDKLDYNFTYLYEKMSNIEFDNASFKDKLAYFMKQTPKIHEKYQAQLTSGGTEILNTLAKYTEKSKIQPNFLY